MKLSAFMRKATGTRRRTTTAGSCFSQASIAGSKALQCGQAYEKNSSTSTLPAGTPGGCGVSTRVKSLPSTGPGCAKAGPATSAEAAAAERRLQEKRRRFMFVFMVKATVEGGFAPTRQVPRQRRAGGGRRWAAARSTRLHLDADGGDRLADLAQPLLEVRNELAQLGGDGGVGAQKRPALVVDRPGAQPAGKPCRDDRRHGREQGIRQAQPLREPAERRAGAQCLCDRHRDGGRNGLGRHQQSLAAGPGW